MENLEKKYMSGIVLPSFTEYCFLNNGNNLTLDNLLNKYRGKVWNVLGDSLTYINSSNSDKNYFNFVDDYLGFKQINNYGANGSCLSSLPTTANKCMTQRYKNMPDADLVTVFGGINDLWANGKLGNLSDTTDESVYGALKILMEGLIKKYPTSDILFITPIKQNHAQCTDPNTNGLTLKQVKDAICKVAEIYSLPVLDLYSESGICPTLDIHKTMYTTDGLHLNKVGHEKIGYKILKKLMTL